jgi:hypothetical protein
MAASLASCGSSAPSRTRPPERDPSRWLTVDAAHREATITLQLAFDTAASGLNIDGGSVGALLFSVPSGWHLRFVCENFADARRYSCVIGRSPGVRVVDPKVVDVLHPTNGLAHRQKSSFAFLAPQPTRYRILAVSGGRAVTGMWIVLKVSAGGRPYARWLR